MLYKYEEIYINNSQQILKIINMLNEFNIFLNKYLLEIEEDKNNFKNHLIKDMKKQSKFKATKTTTNINNNKNIDCMDNCNYHETHEDTEGIENFLNFENKTNKMINIKKNNLKTVIKLFQNLENSIKDLQNFIQNNTKNKTDKVINLSNELSIPFQAQQSDCSIQQNIQPQQIHNNESNKHIHSDIHINDKEPIFFKKTLQGNK